MRPDGGLRALFRARVPPPAHWQSVETGGTSRGVPDSNVCCAGTETWIEFKTTRGWTVPLRPEQVGWIVARTRHGGRCLIATRQLGGMRDDLWIHDGRWARELRDGGLLAALPRGRWDGGPESWDWTAVRRLLA